MARLVSRKSKSDLTARQSNILDFLVEHISTQGYPPSMREIGSFFSIKSTNGVSDHLRALERKGYISRSAQKGRGIQVLKTSNGLSRTSHSALGRMADQTQAQPGGDARSAADGGRSPQTNKAAASGDSNGHRQVSQMPDFADVAPVAANTVNVPLLGKVAAGKPILAVELAEQNLSFDAALLPSAGAGTFALRVQGRSMIDAGILPEDLVFVLPQPHASNGEIVVAMVDGEATVKRYYDEGDRVRLQPENRDMAPIFVDKDNELQLLGRVVGVWRRFG